MRLALLLSLTLLAAAAADATDPRPRLSAIAEAAQREQIAVALAWLKGCDLTLPPDLVLGPDPRDSEREAKAEADAARSQIAAARLVLERAIAKPDDAAVQREVLGFVGGGARGSFVDLYLRLRAGGPARPAAKKAGGVEMRD